RLVQGFRLGEHANRGERGQELLLGPLQVRDVLGDAEEPTDSSPRVPHGVGPVPDPTDRSVRTHQPVLVPEGPRLVLPRQAFPDTPAVFGVDAVEERFSVPVQILTGPPPEPFVTEADVQRRPARAVGDPEGLGKMLFRQGEGWDWGSGGRLAGGKPL